MATISDLILPLGNNKEHSITEVIATFFLPQKIVKADRLKELKERPHFKGFSKIDELFQQHLNFEIKQGKVLSISNENLSPSGYRFDKFDENGLLSERITFENEDNRARIVFNCLNYKGWEEYRSRLFELMESIKEFDNSFYFFAIGLTYIDKFKIIEAEKFELQKVFNDNRGILPYDLIQSNEFFHFKLNVTQVQKIQSTENRFLDNIEVKNQIEKTGEHTLSVMHSSTPVFDQESIYKSIDSFAEFKDLLNFCHSKNKQKLESLFKEDVLDLIGLTNK